MLRRKCVEDISNDLDFIYKNIESNLRDGDGKVILLQGNKLAAVASDGFCTEILDKFRDRIIFKYYDIRGKVIFNEFRNKSEYLEWLKNPTF